MAPRTLDGGARSVAARPVHRRCPHAVHSPCAWAPGGISARFATTLPRARGATGAGLGGVAMLPPPGPPGPRPDAVAARPRTEAPTPAVTEEPHLTWQRVAAHLRG